MQRIIHTRANAALHKLDGEVDASWAEMREDYAVPWRSNRFRDKAKAIQEAQDALIQGFSEDSSLSSSADASSRSRVIADSQSTHSGSERDESAIALPVEASTFEDPPEELKEAMVYYRGVEAWLKKVEEKFAPLQSSYERKTQRLLILTRAQGLERNDLAERLKKFHPENEEQKKVVELFQNMGKGFRGYQRKIEAAKRGILTGAEMIAKVAFQLYGRCAPVMLSHSEPATVSGMTSDEDGSSRLELDRGPLQRQVVDAASTEPVELDSEAEAERRENRAFHRRMRAVEDLGYMMEDFENHWALYDEKVAEWKAQHRLGEAHGTLTDFHTRFLREGQKISEDLRKAEEEASAAASYLRELGMWASADQSSRFPEDTVDEEVVTKEAQRAMERTDKESILKWRDAVQDGEPSVGQSSRERGSDQSSLPEVVFGETPWELLMEDNVAMSTNGMELGCTPGKIWPRICKGMMGERSSLQRRGRTAFARVLTRRIPGMTLVLF